MQRGLMKIGERSMDKVYELVPHRIRVSFQKNGIYQFIPESATGKTYLYKQACKLYKAMDDILPLTYSRGMDVIDYLQKSLNQHSVKIILLDCFDMFVTKDLLEYLECLRNEYIILMDYKRSIPKLQIMVEICYIELKRDEISVYDCASIQKQRERAFNSEEICLV